MIHRVFAALLLFGLMQAGLANKATAAKCKEITVGSLDSTEAALAGLGLVAGAGLMIAEKNPEPAVQLLHGTELFASAAVLIRNFFKPGARISACPAPSLASRLRLSHSVILTNDETLAKELAHTPSLERAEMHPASGSFAAQILALTKTTPLITTAQIEPSIKPLATLPFSGTIHPVPNRFDIPGPVPTPLFPAHPVLFASLHGQVSDAARGEPIAGAVVKLVGPQPTADRWRATVTGAGGAYTFGFLPAGHYLLSVRAAGYSPYATDVTLFGGGSAGADAKLTNDYPCTFSLSNRTPWWVATVFVHPQSGFGPELGPFQTVPITVATRGDMSARATFRDHAPVTWPSIALSCEGAASATLMPPPD